MITLVLGLIAITFITVLYLSYRRKAAKIESVERDIEEAKVDSHVLDRKHDLKKINKSNV